VHDPHIPGRPDYVVYTILDDDGPGVSIADAQAREQAGGLEFGVTLSGTSVQQIEVDYATVDGSASASVDYEAVSGTLTIPVGATGAAIAVPLWLAYPWRTAPAEADYRFERSAEACGGGGIGEGMVDAGLTSVHPYADRRIGAGWVRAALGVVVGDVVLDRSEPDHAWTRTCRCAWQRRADGIRSVAENGSPCRWWKEAGVLALKSGDGAGPVRARSAAVGRARVGLDVSGVAQVESKRSMTPFVRAFARRLGRRDRRVRAWNWRRECGSGVYRDAWSWIWGSATWPLTRRRMSGSGARMCVSPSCEGGRDRLACFAVVATGRGDTFRRDQRACRMDRAAGRVRAGRAPLDGAGNACLWHGAWVGFGDDVPGGRCRQSRRGGTRLGVRHGFGDRSRGLVVEWWIEPGTLVAGNRISLAALGRF